MRPPKRRLPQQIGALLRKAWPALMRATGEVSCRVVPLEPAQVGEVSAARASALTAGKADPSGLPARTAVDSIVRWVQASRKVRTRLVLFAPGGRR
jgi:hypothetical protein